MREIVCIRFYVSVTQSRRRIVYLPVRPLDGLEQFKNSPWIQHASVRRVVVELCGYARGLLYVREILARHYPNSAVSPTYEALCQLLSVELCSVTNGAPTSAELIAACLLGKRVKCSDCPSESLPYTYSYYIAQVCLCQSARLCVFRVCV